MTTAPDQDPNAPKGPANWHSPLLPYANDLMMSSSRQLATVASIAFGAALIGREKLQVTIPMCLLVGSVLLSAVPSFLVGLRFQHAARAEFVGEPIGESRNFWSKGAWVSFIFQVLLLIVALTYLVLSQ